MRTIIFFALAVSSVLFNTLLAEDIQTSASNAVVIEASTGKILFDKKAKEQVYPASLTKLLSLYIIFDNLKKHNLSLNTPITISENAFKQGGEKNGSSTMFLNPGDKVMVNDLLQGITVTSGNDATIALAEHIAGSEENFSNYMNEYAEKLQLTGSHFMNATGWPNTSHYSTVYDIAIIAKNIINSFPEFYHYFGQKTYTYRSITQTNRNLLLFDKSVNVDGIKTGHTEISGFSLAFSATNSQGIRIIGVVSHLKSSQEREKEAKKLINWVFAHINVVNIYKKGDVIAKIPVWNGKENYLTLKAPDNIRIVDSKFINKQDFDVKMIIPNKLNAPIFMNQEVGKIIITNKLTGNQIVYSLTSPEKIKRSSFFGRFFKTPNYGIKKILGSN